MVMYRTSIMVGRLFPLERVIPSCVLADLSLLPTRGPCSKYEISIPEGDFKGKIEMKFEGDPFKVLLCTPN